MRHVAALFLIISALAVALHAEMSQSAYVWQRQWTPKVEDAVRTCADAVDGYTVLCAEIMRGSQGKPTWINVHPNWEALKASGVPITLAIRVGVYSGPFGVDRAMTQCLLSEVRKALRSARAAGVPPAAVEIDFDCATRNLAGYAQWLRLIRRELDGVPLSITTLPTWMSDPEAFADLVAEANQFVLQVHSVQRAETIDSDASLCDPQLARKWTALAARMGRSFRVALPTYAYRLGYDATGGLAEVAAEDASPLKNPEWSYRVIRAEPDVVASIVRSFQAELPENCLGVIWYRLPLGGERHNWDPLTWRAVMDGRENEQGWKASLRPRPDGAVELELFQGSAIALEPPDQVRVAWSEGAALAWDGQRHYSVRTVPDHALVWRWPDTMSPPLLPQGTRWTIGWLRMEAVENLTISIIGNDE